MESSELDSGVGVVLEKIERLKELCRGNAEAEKILNELEGYFKNVEGLTLMSLRELSRERSKEDLIQFVDRMKRDEDVKRFVEVVKYPWVASRAFALVMQVLWIVAAAISFMMGVYLFFPPYVFFGSAHGNVTATIRKTLELISQNPQVLSAIDPLFKILGFVMMAIAIVSLYQAHLISTYLKEK